MNSTKQFLMTGVLLFSIAVLPAVAGPRGSRSRSSSSGSHYVKGHTTKNGTYVQGHYQTNPDHSFGNNWSTKGNVNPRTGEAGTKTMPGVYSGALSSPAASPKVAPASNDTPVRDGTPAPAPTSEDGSPVSASKTNDTRLRLKNGELVEGRLVQFADETYVLETDNGKREIKASDVAPTDDKPAPVSESIESLMTILRTQIAGRNYNGAVATVDALKSAIQSQAKK